MNELQSVARIRVHPGRLDEFKRLAAQALQSVRTKDTGTLQYDLFFSDDQMEWLVYERYRDSEALLEHFANLGPTMSALLATCSITGEVCGKPSPVLRKAIESSGVRIYSPYQSI